MFILYHAWVLYLCIVKLYTLARLSPSSIILLAFSDEEYSEPCNTAENAAQRVLKGTRSSFFSGRCGIVLVERLCFSRLRWLWRSHSCEARTPQIYVSFPVVKLRGVQVVRLQKSERTSFLLVWV